MTTATKKRCRVLIVEDHPMVASGIAETLGSHDGFEVVGVAANESEALAAADEHHPEVATIDITLEKGSGLALIRSLTEAHPKLRVLVFTMHDEVLYAERTMRSGAHGYLNKSASADELIEAVRTVARGELAMSDSMNARLVQRAIGNSDGNDGVASLTNRELEIFEHIGRGRQLSDIASALSISTKTVETHREHIKKKLGLGSSTELARFAVAWIENPG